MKHYFTSITALLLAPLAAVHAADASARKPNIVLILADDLGYGSLGCYGNREVQTPNIDRIAASGMRFTDFHSNGALCTPTRAALLTGRYQQRCARVADEELSPVFRQQRRQNPEQQWAWGISTAELTLPAALKQAGYRTALIGKWHLGYDYKFHPMNFGFDEFRGFVGGKGSLYEGGHRVPFIAWWPETIPAGSASGEPLMTMDLFPTFANLAGVHLPADRDIDGMDLMPVLKGRSSEVPRDLHWQSGDAWAVRRGSWKLMGERRKPVSLVNLHKDIGEADNLLHREPARAGQLMKAREQWVKSLGDPTRNQSRPTAETPAARSCPCRRAKTTSIQRRSPWPRR